MLCRDNRRYLFQATEKEFYSQLERVLLSGRVVGTGDNGDNDDDNDDEDEDDDKNDNMNEIRDIVERNSKSVKN